MSYWYNIEKKGVLKSEVNFKDGKENGLYTSYHDNGKIKLTEEYKMDRNPVMLKDKCKEILVDLAKYGLMPKTATKEERMR